MTKREGAIISAHTGVLCTMTFEDTHKYIEEIMKRPILVHELGDKEVLAEIKEKSRYDFVEVIRSQKD